MLSKFLRLVVGALLAYIVFLFRDYDGLIDPLAKPIDYWPFIHVQVCVVLIVIALCIDIAVQFRNRRGADRQP
ncbi:hypothetical protein K227x_31610 [Rubripirellula lacrimiformis]|uniref:Uncharacterized protein n=1 Tax=Rubripirellula lacrimiformis TaxID=1930273 RepID=A0A517NC94_9BACT|nr:hypothetical protein [Rubripirellula lacrimiformis]QDT04765.1 hypothetical protein K227x_31610 [Rubripirellula lacrimiformis]